MVTPTRRDNKEKVGMRRALLCGVVAVLGLGTVACGSSGSSSSAQSRTVQVDNTTDKFNGAFLEYFPKDVAVHPGDTVDFHENWTGEPHTVTMGTLVETGLKAVQAIPPAQQQSAPPPPAYAKLPTLLPQGPGDANQNAAQPCFLTTGEPPADPATACPKPQQTQTDFDGTQTYYNSGFLPEGDTYKVKLSPNIKPGTYHYYCNLHGPDMSGTITVKAKDAAVPSSSTVDSTGKKELDDVVNKVLPDYNKAKAGQFPLPGVKNVAGYSSQAAQQALINEMIPAEIDAKVGEKVTWTVMGPHTISFGKAPIEPGKFITKGPDGAWHLNAQAGMPVGFPPPPESNGPPPANAPPVTPINGGTYDGTGFKSTGTLTGFGPPFPQPSITFTKPGTYSYVCLIHPKMGGVVKVT
jgi:plastocyanin